MKLCPLLLALCVVPLYADGPMPFPQDKFDQGLWWLYQAQYDKAYSAVEQFTQDHPDDPAGYFYLAAIDWWHLAQDMEYDLPEVSQRFSENYEKTIAVSRKEYEQAKTQHEKALACFYAGGAEGLRGRRLITLGDWVSAYFAGRRGYRLLRRAIRYDPELYDAYMGLGIYDYYTDTLPRVQRVLASLFIHGNKKRGLEELQLAIDKGKHVHVEGRMFLLEIYTYEEHEPEKALPIAEELVKEYPNSPVMSLAEITALYQMHRWDDVIRESNNFLMKSINETPYFPKRGEMPALYLLGISHFWGKFDLDGAMKYFEEILDAPDDGSRWVTYAYLRRGQIEDLRGWRDKAVSDYKEVLNRKDSWGSHREARASLQTPFH